MSVSSSSINKHRRTLRRRLSRRHEKYILHPVTLPDGSIKLLPLPSDNHLPACDPLITTSHDDIHYYASSDAQILRQRTSISVDCSNLTSPHEHLRNTQALCHPLDLTDPLPAPLKHAISFVCANQHRVPRLRRSQCKQIRRLARALEPTRQLWLAEMHPQILGFCSHLHLPLMAVLLRRANYCDSSLALELVYGLAVHGNFHTPGNIFAEGVSQKWTYTDPNTVLRTDSLKDDLTYQRLQRESPSTDDAILWQAAIDEVDNHTMAGPIDGDSYATGYLISRRFPVRQVSKTRPCDDYTASGLNDCQYFDRRMTLPTIDLITQMYNTLSDSWPDDLDLRIWSADHQSAYRQVASFPPHTFSTLVAIRNPSTAHLYLFRHFAQAFGARSSVWNYLRVSQALVFLSRAYFSTIVVSYIDDFSGGEDVTTVDSAYSSFLFLNSILGWKVKNSKCSSPSHAMVLLGIKISVYKRAVSLSIPREKLDRICASLVTILSSGVLPFGQALKLCGKLTFATSTFASRAGRPFIRVLYDHIYFGRKSGSSSLSHTAIDCLRSLLFLLRSFSDGRCLTLSSLHSLPSAIIYSDADGDCRLGACLIRPHYKHVYFSEPLPLSLSAISCSDPPNIVFQECCAALCAISTFGPMLRNHRVMIFIDATSVEHMILKGSSKSPSLNRLVLAFWLLAAKFGISMWIGGVRSQFNLADAPSRRLYHDFLSWDRYRLASPHPSLLHYGNCQHALTT